MSRDIRLRYGLGRAGRDSASGNPERSYPLGTVARRTMALATVMLAAHALGPILAAPTLCGAALGAECEAAAGAARRGAADRRPPAPRRRARLPGYLEVSPGDPLAWLRGSGRA
jgi:hypothetical protein